MSIIRIPAVNPMFFSTGFWGKLGAEVVDCQWRIEGSAMGMLCQQRQTGRLLYAGLSSDKSAE